MAATTTAAAVHARGPLAILLNNGMVAVNNRPVNRLVRAAPIAGAALVCVVLLPHAWLALGSGYGVNHVGGVWLALAQDAREGVFYRALSDSGQYGGTRYGPLLFLIIAALMRAGAPAMAAGQAAGILGLAVLAGGAFAFLAALGRGRRPAVVGAALSIAPYFVQQSAFAIRVEPLAAGLGLWGAACVARRLRGDAPASWAMAAAGCFTLAVAAKPTAGYAAAAALLALVCARRRRDALALAGLCLAFAGALVAATALASGGRAVESFRACALAGSSPLDLLRPAFLVATAARLASSRLLITVLALAGVALAASRRQWCALPALLFIGAIAASVLALGTAGTILTNQGVEPYVAAALLLVWIVGERGWPEWIAAAALTGLLVWTAGQDVREIRSLAAADVRQALPAERAAIVTAVQRCDGPVLAESPLVPILAGRRIVVLDPFAFRVASLTHPDLTADLVGRLGRREFGCVILDQDPESEAGRGWYANVHLGSAVLGAIREHYRFRESAGGHRFFTPTS